MEGTGTGFLIGWKGRNVAMHILTLHAGSSSLKFSLVTTDGERRIAHGQAEWASEPTRYMLSVAGGDTIRVETDWADVDHAIQRVVSDLRRKKIANMAAVVHRVVHGGTRFSQPVVITDEVQAALHELLSLAPLHNPCSLEGIAVARETFPNCPHIAVFDTAFHATLAPEAYTYPVPYEWTEKWNLRRFGFHGLSHAYCAARAAEMLNRPLAELRLIVAHLGHGASLAAIQGGQSVDTTMGFTPLEGLMMATRSGTIDPGLVLHIAREHGIPLVEVERVLNEQSGLLGVSGVSADIRQVHQAAVSGNSRAQLAISIYIHRLRQAIGAMAATLGKVDALVFTGGVGEHDAAVRAATCDRLAVLGMELDLNANVGATPDSFVSTPNSQAAIIVVATDEEMMLTREARDVITKSPDLMKSII